MGYEGIVGYNSDCRDSTDEVWIIFTRLKIKLSQLNIILNYDQAEEILRSLRQSYKAGIDHKGLEKRGHKV